MGKPIAHHSFAGLKGDTRLKAVFESSVPAVVVFPVSHPVGLSVIRCLSGQGIPILAVDFKPDSAGLYSNEVVPLLLPRLYDNEETFAEGMLAIGACFRVKPVLFLVDDEDLFLSLKRADQFERYYRMPLSPWSVVQPIVDKGKLYRTCREQNFPIPRTWFIASEDDLENQRTQITFPCIVKPTFSTQFRKRFGVKAVRFEEFDQLREFVKPVLKEGIDFVLQEFIAGTAECLYTYGAYSDDEGNVIAAFTGRKLRQFPPDFGTCRLGESVDDPALERLGRRLLKVLRYRGISLTEFKRDPQGNYYLMELNPRPGDWPEHLAYLCGANLVLTAYRETLGEKVPSHRSRRCGVTWAYLCEGCYYCVRGYRLFGYPEEHRGLLRWLKDLRGLKTDAFFAWRDPLPAWMRFKGMVRDFAARERALRKGA